MMEPIRVLHNIASLHFGGAQSFVMNVYRNIDRSKIQFDFVVTPEEKRDLYEQVEQMGGRIFVHQSIQEKIISVTVSGGTIFL